MSMDHPLEYSPRGWAMSGHQIESETADVSVDPGSFLMSRLGDGGSRDAKRRSEREKMAESDLAFDLVTCRDLAH